MNKNRRHRSSFGAIPTVNACLRYNFPLRIDNKLMTDEQAIANLEKMIEQLKQIIKFSGNFRGNWEDLTENLYGAIALIEKTIEDVDPEYEEYPYELD